MLYVKETKEIDGVSNDVMVGVKDTDDNTLEWYTGRQVYDIVMSTGIKIVGFYLDENGKVTIRAGVVQEPKVGSDSPFNEFKARLYDTDCITYGSPYLLHIAHLANDIMKVLFYDNLVERYKHTNDVYGEVKYWGRNNNIVNFEYNKVKDCISKTKRVLNRYCDELILCIFESGFTDGIYLKYDPTIDWFYLYNKDVFDTNDVGYGNLKLLSPYCDSLAKFDDIIFKGTINDFKEWLNKFK